MARELHELRALVTSRITGFVRGMERAAQSTLKMRQAWATAGRDVSAAASRIGLAVTGMGALVARTFSEFEATMTRAGAVTRTLGTQDFEALTAAAKTMGETTVFSASQAAGAIEQMGLAGLKTEEIIAALPGALQLAAAAQVEIAEAADTAAKLMRAFGAAAEDLVHINDVLVATFTRSNTTLGQLGEALTPVAPVAKALGVSLEDTAAAIAKMSDAGFQGSIAGTSLRNILSRLAGATPAVTNQLKALGVNTLDSAGKMRPFLDILADIERAALTDAQVLQLFGARGGPQLLALLEVGSQGLRDFSAELKASGGIAKEISEANLKTISGQFTLLKSAIEGVVLEAGTRLRPTFEQLIQTLLAFLDANKTDIIHAMESALRQMGGALVSLVGWLAQNGSALFEMAQQFGGFLARIMEFLAAHPQLMAALLAFKVTGLLGINQALGSLGSALLQTISTMAQLTMAFGKSTAAASAAGQSLLGLKVAAVALLAVGMWKLADWMGLFGAAVEDANEVLEQQNKLLAERSRLEGGIAERAIADVAHIENAGARKVALEKELEAIRRRSGEMDRSAIDADRRATEAGDVFGANVPGTFAAGNAERLNKEAAEAKARAERHVQAVAELEAEIARLAAKQKEDELRKETADFDARKAFEEGRMPGEPGGGAPGGGDGGPEAEAEQAAAEAAQNIADAIREAQLQNIEKQTPGFSNIRDFAGMEGMTGAALGQYAATQGASQVDATMLGAEYNALQQQHGGQVPEQLVDQLIQRFVSKMNETAALEARGVEAAQTFDPFVQRLRELKAEGTVGAEWASEMAAKARELATQFQQGNISAEQLASGMQSLRAATDEATDAARRKEEQERREALIKGDFAGAGLNFNDAVQDRIAQMQQQRFNAQVDQAANRYAMLNGILPRVQQGFQGLNNGMQQFGQQLQQIPVSIGIGFGGGGGGGGGAQQAFNTITSFLGSQAGQIAALKNQIALTQQRVSLFGEKSAGSFMSFGFGSQGYRDRRDAERQLKALYRQLNQILYQPPPQFTDILGTGESFFSDPGLQNQNVEVKLELPNLRKMNNADAALLARTIMDESARQGRRV